MSDSGFNTEVDSDDVRPVDAVAADTEVTDAVPPADDTEQADDDADVSADQQESGDDGKIDYKAMAKAKAEKQKKERERRKAEEEKRIAAEERVARLEAQIAEMSAGKRPSAEDYHYDPEGYLKAVQEWESKRANIPKPQETTQRTNAAPEVPDEIVEFQIESEERMRSQRKDYDAKAEALKVKMQGFGLAPDAALASLADACIGMEGVDYATAIVGLNEVPGALEAVVKAARSGSEGLVRKHIRDAAKKVAPVVKKKIETKPEPKVASTGGVNSAQAELEKVREEYRKNPTQANFAKVQVAKRKLKS